MATQLAKSPAFGPGTPGIKSATGLASEGCNDLKAYKLIEIIGIYKYYIYIYIIKL